MKILNKRQCINDNSILVRVLFVRASERGTPVWLWQFATPNRIFKDIVIKQADKCSVEALIVTFDVVL